MVKKILIISGFIAGFLLLIFFGLTVTFNFLRSAPQILEKSYPDMARSPFDEFAVHDSAEYEISYEADRGMDSSSPAKVTAPSTRMVIRTGTIHMTMDDIFSSMDNIIRYTEENDGFVLSSEITERDDVPSGRITIQVPSKNFNEAMEYFKSIAKKVTNESVSGRDVTEEYTDLNARLRNLEATEDQLLEIMERSGEVSDVLEVQRELSSTREEIERTKGRMQYLEQRVEMSTINLYLALSEELLPLPDVDRWQPLYVAQEAWISLLGSLRSIVYALIWISIYGLFLALLPFFIIWIVVRKKREKNKKRPKKKS